ncbi:hypothetical protein CKO12_13620 [Chromatium okenii]|nr:hypothetical protein [Chromatium okenii]
MNEFGSLQQNIVKHCGYPKHTKSEIAEILKNAKESCRIQDNRAAMTSYLESRLAFFPPTHPIHKKVLDQCFRNK